MIFHVHPKSNGASFRLLLNKRLKIKPDESIFIFAGHKILNPNKDFGETYNVYRSEDGFLYLGYMEDNPF